MVGGVRKLEAAGDVADGIDASVGGLEALVDRDAVLVIFDAGGIEAEPDHIGPAPARHQEMAAFDRLLAAGAGEQDLDPRVRRPRPARWFRCEP